MGGQRDTPGFGASQLGIRDKVNNYLGSSVGVELGIRYTKDSMGNGLDHASIVHFDEWCV